MLQRTLVSGGWWILLVVYLLFFGFASATLHNIHQIRSVERDQRGVENALVVATVAALTEGAVFLVLSAFSLLGRWCSHETDIGVWYGVTTTLAFALAFGYLPAATMLGGYVQVAHLWEKSDVWMLKNTIQLRGAAVLAFVVMAVAIAYAIVLLFCKRAFAEAPRRRAAAAAQRTRHARGGRSAPPSEAAVLYDDTHDEV